MNSTNGELLESARKCNTQALGLLLDRFRPLLIGMARDKLSPRLRTKTGESDLVQATFSAAIQGFSQFQGQTEAEFVSWLTTILSNLAASNARYYLKTAKRQVKREQSLVSPSGNNLDIPATGMSPSSVISRQVELEDFVNYINGLPEQVKQVVMLRYREKLRFKEIAQVTNMSLDAVKKSWARAIAGYVRLPHEVQH